MSPEPAVVDWAAPPQFEIAMQARFHEADLLGHVNNAVYLHYMEQAAIEHATSLGLTVEASRAFGGVFVARRHEVEFLRPAFPGEVVRVQTWLAEPRGARVTRCYQLFRVTDSVGEAFTGRIPARETRLAPEAVLVRATTEWVFMSEDGRPRRIPEGILGLFAQARASAA
ncbi:MAG: acyl-CoA thioesterase [Thermomicrobiales bacterium]|nr:acyl-CoA thioesterase [Thermomicrobiales bacterium]